MPSKTHYLLIDIYSTCVRITTDSEFVFTNLSKDFQLFTIIDETVTDAQVDISSCLKSPPYE
jgi:hypothetical protein